MNTLSKIQYFKQLSPIIQIGGYISLVISAKKKSLFPENLIVTICH